MNLTITHTITIIELIWTVCGLLGLWFNGRVFRRAAGDYIELRRRRINFIREYAAITTMIAFGTWTVGQLMFALVGAVAMAQPNVSSSLTPTQAAITVCFILVAVLFALSAYIVDVRRQVIVRKIAEMEEGFEELEIEQGGEGT